MTPDFCAQAISHTLRCAWAHPELAALLDSCSARLPHPPGSGSAQHKHEDTYIEGNLLVGLFQQRDSVTLGTLKWR